MIFHMIPALSRPRMEPEAPSRPSSGPPRAGTHPSSISPDDASPGSPSPVHALAARPLLISELLLFAGLAIGGSVVLIGSFGSPWGPPVLPWPMGVLGALALVLAGLSEALLFRAARQEGGGYLAQDVLQHSPIAQVLLDRDGRVVLMSAGQELRLRVQTNELVGAPFAALFPLRESSRVAKAVAQPGPHTLEIELPPSPRVPKGTSLSLVLGPLEPGARTRVAAVLDMSDRARLVSALAGLGAELARSNRDLERFAYVASHDLQEPLRMVSSYTQLLGARYRGKLDDDADEFLGYASEGAERMKHLIDDLLVYSRVGARREEPREVSMDRVLDRSLSDLRARIAETGALVDRHPLPPVLGNEGELVQLVENLVGNAIKFHGDLAPRIKVYAEEVAGEVRYTVEDRGIGILPPNQERIFEPFVRLHSREEYPGTGIGLAICKKVVEGLGGRIWVESAGEPGGSTRFVFTLRPPRVREGHVAAPKHSGEPTSEQARAWELIEERLKGLA